MPDKGNVPGSRTRHARVTLSRGAGRAAKSRRLNSCRGRRPRGRRGRPGRDGAGASGDGSTACVVRFSGCMPLLVAAVTSGPACAMRSSSSPTTFLYQPCWQRQPRHWLAPRVFVPGSRSPVVSPECWSNRPPLSIQVVLAKALATLISRSCAASTQRCESSWNLGRCQGIRHNWRVDVKHHHRLASHCWKPYQFPNAGRTWGQHG